MNRAQMVLAALLAAGCSAVAPEPGASIPDAPAFEKTRWDMTLEQVARLYPAARAEPTELVLEGPFGQQPARIRFCFARGVLSVVELELLSGAEPADPCGSRFEQAWRELAARHGPPERGDSRHATWAPQGTEVILSCEPRGGRPRDSPSITYRERDGRPTIPRFDPIPPPRPGHQYE
ncbi:MAG: hypothetical protein ACYC8T_07440 [Myxococcaceae bacterium]